MRLLAVDFGFSRIGIAVGETSPVAFSTRSPLKASGSLDKDAAAIDRLAATEEAKVLVIGLPKEPSGEEGRMAKVCRTLAARLQSRGWEVHLVDESLTTVEATQAMKEQGVPAPRRRRLEHGEAAVVILERYLHAQTPP